MNDGVDLGPVERRQRDDGAAPYVGLVVTSGVEDDRQPGRIADCAQRRHRRLAYERVGVVGGKRSETGDDRWFRTLLFATGEGGHLDHTGIGVVEGAEKRNISVMSGDLGRTAAHRHGRIGEC